MGLDLTLAVLVLLAAVRGWFRGFVIQAIHLGGLVGCVYLASPLRDLARPEVKEYFPTIEPGLLDRLIWWPSCLVSYVVTVGLATWLVKIYRRRPYGDPDLHRGDQAAGFLLGAAKGLVIASVVAFGIERYALGYFRGTAWAEEQVKESQALTLADEYHPAERLWHSPAVQSFVAHIQREGLRPKPEAEPAEPAPLRTASRPRTLELTDGDWDAPVGSDDRVIDEIDQELRKSR